MTKMALFLFGFLVLTIGIGLLAARRIKNAADFAIAGRHLPLYMIITTTFATWFGSEIVLGVPAKFIEGGLRGVVEDPFGAGMCLILVGLFFAGKLYRMTLLTISDYYRERYGRVVEIVCSLIIMLSYLGWVLFYPRHGEPDTWSLTGPGMWWVLIGALLGLIGGQAESF